MKALIFLALIGLTFAIGNRIEQIIAGEIMPEQKDLEEMYLEFMKKYGAHPIYEGNSLKSLNRFEIFKNSVYTIMKHNMEKANTWEMGITQFAALTEEEFLILPMFSAPQNCSATSPRDHIQNLKLGNFKLPDFIDWREHGVVSDVKDQGRCGSCWTFSTTGCLEAHYAMKMKIPPVLFSEQQLIDCARDSYGNNGCKGGLPSNAFEYFKNVSGANTEDDYPYQSGAGQDNFTCRFDPGKVVATVPGGSFNITPENETQMVEHMAAYGPISIAYQVVGDFRLYKGGIYTSKTCKNSERDVNHAVLAVGYGSENSLDYWIVKNSWGKVWGDQGYFKIKRGVNMCGVAVCSAYPLLN